MLRSPPDRRPLKIFAFDPMLGREARNRITIDVPYEQVLVGPIGQRIEVIDYDPANKTYYKPVDLNDPAIAIRGGLDPSESDPQFHQQMVYAVASKVLENFDLALGRRMMFRGRDRLRILPHALQVANAYYHRGTRALLFGYFRTGKDNARVGLPAQTVFTCLSHDIIAHETAHAVVDRLRPHFLEGTNADVGAFHEGFADLVAILQHFSFPGILRDAIQSTRADLRDAGPMVRLAEEFGRATGTELALRDAVRKPDPAEYANTKTPHERGSILVAAVFDAFFTTYQNRIRDLIRIATGGTGRLPDGDMHPDLVNRIAGEASRTAQSMLTMCIRAFDYLPPVDVTFGDYLRALVTADRVLFPDDASGQRAAVIEAFRARGIFPTQVTSLAEDALIWGAPEDLPILPILDSKKRYWMTQSFQDAAEDWGHSWADAKVESGYADAADQPDDVATLQGQLAVALREYATKCAPALGLHPRRTISVKGFHPTFRFSRQGQLVVELVAQFVQEHEEDAKLGRVPARAGVTVVASPDGRVRHVISKPLPGGNLAASFRAAADIRRERTRAFVADCDECDDHLPWKSHAAQAERRRGIIDLARLHAGHRRGARRG